MAKYRSEISSFQYGDHLGQNRRHRLKQRLNIKKIATFESDASKPGEHTTLQSRELFIGGGGGGVCTLVVVLNFFFSLSLFSGVDGFSPTGAC